MSTNDTREAIMGAARLMVQANGYNALSFREVAAAVGVQSASVHYHFPTKGDLGAALARRYTEELTTYLDGLKDLPDGAEKWAQYYANVFRTPLMNDNRMCMAGIMAAEHSDLPSEVRTEVNRFIDANVGWLSEVLSKQTPKAGREEIERRALAVFAAIEGAQLIARGRGDVAAFDQSIEAYRAAGLLP
jgi:TetR/AcrR family transcriptional regulator, transcriptional repressor for nem operon